MQELQNGHSSGVSEGGGRQLPVQLYVWRFHPAGTLVVGRLGHIVQTPPPEIRRNHLTSHGFCSTQILLEGFAPISHPRIPMLMVECVAEIERRGLTEVPPPTHTHTPPPVAKKYNTRAREV